MQTQALTARITAKASSIQTIADIKAIEVEGSKICSKFWTLRFDAVYKVWRKEGLKPFTTEEVLNQCSY